MQRKLRESWRTIHVRILIAQPEHHRIGSGLIRKVSRSATVCIDKSKGIAKKCDVKIWTDNPISGGTAIVEVLNWNKIPNSLKVEQHPFRIGWLMGQQAAQRHCRRGTNPTVNSRQRMTLTYGGHNELHSVLTQLISPHA